MPQNSAIFSAARIRVQEKHLLNKSKLSKLAQADADEAARLLSEWGYGDKGDASKLDAALDLKLKAARELVVELSSNETVSNAFLMKLDIHNLKVLIKQRLQKDAKEPPLVDGGVFGAQLLSVMVRMWEFDALPAPINSALAALKPEDAAAPDPERISVELDRAYIKYAFSIKNDFTKRYFMAQTNYYNVDAMLRLKRMGLGAERMDGFYIDGGEVTLDSLKTAFEAQDAKLAELLTSSIKDGGIKSALKASLEEYAGSGSLASLERDRDNCLISIARDAGRWEMETVAPVIGFLLAVEQEVKCIRLIVTAKRNGFSNEIIEERLRELYG